MPYNFSRTDDTIDLDLVGDIDLEITPDLKNQLLTEIENGRNLRINGSEVSYIDSSGISVLIIAMQNCNKKDIKFTINDASDEMLRVIKMAHLDKLLPLKSQTEPTHRSKKKTKSGQLDKSDMDALADNDDAIAKELADLSISANESMAEEAEEPLSTSMQEFTADADTEMDTDTDADTDVAQDFMSEPIEAPELPQDSGENSASKSDMEGDDGIFKPGTF